MSKSIVHILRSNPGLFHQVVDVNKNRDVVVPIDLTSTNTALSSDVVGDIYKFEDFINGFLSTKTTEQEIVEDFCSILKKLLADRSILLKTALSAEEYAKTNFGYAAFEKNWREILD